METPVYTLEQIYTIENIKEFLNAHGYQEADEKLDRLIVTILLYNEGMLINDDEIYVRDDEFKKLYQMDIQSLIDYINTKFININIEGCLTMFDIIRKYIDHKLAENKIGVYNINDIENLGKLLALFDTRTQKLIYTPTGVKYWLLTHSGNANIGDSSWPSYYYLPHVIAKDNNLRYLPFVKGQTPNRILQRLNNLKPEKPVVDIDLSNVCEYNGSYIQCADNKLVSIMCKNMEKIYPSQNVQCINLAMIQKDTVGRPFSPTHTTIEIVSKHNKEGDFDLLASHDGSYIASSDTNFIDVYEDLIKNNVTHHMVIAKTVKKISHAMGLVINIYKKTIEIFDPNGITPDTKHLYLWVKFLIEYLKNKGLGVFKRIISADMPYSPQTLILHSDYMREDQKTGYRNRPTCIVWSFYYLLLKSKNPEAELDNLMRHIVSTDLNNMGVILRKVSSISYGQCNQV